MGQILGQDRIATPSHSSGTITLPPSLLTLGGRQYRTSTLSRLISADVTLTANTLYFVYAQIVSGVPALRISLSPPSLYSISNPTAKLVTAFYSNGLGPVGLGSFAAIDIVPRTQNIQAGPLVITSTGTSPTKGGTPSIDSTEWYRDGEFMVYRAQFEQTVAGTNGTGNYLFAMPTNLFMNLTGYLAANLATGFGSFTGRFAVGIDQYAGYLAPFNVSQFLIYFQWQRESGATQAASLLNASVGSLGAGGMQYGFNNVRVPIQGWNNTPLKDL